MKVYTEVRLLDPNWAEQFCHGDWSWCVRFQREQRGEPHPDRMLPDGTIAARLRQASGET
jgi:hypothetical protein